MMRILCLHGFNSNPERMLESMNGLMKMNPDIEFIIPRAPLSISEDRSCWFYYHPTDHIHVNQSVSPSGKLDGSIYGLDDSLLFCKTLLSEHFDGILGFSQGAAMLSLLCKYNLVPDVKLYFISGFLVEDMDIQLHSSLHIIGKRDKVISRDRSEALRSRFLDNELFVHKGGHIIPAFKIWI